jgi:hypothetical protein
VWEKVAQVAADQHAQATLAQLVAAGMSESTLARLVAAVELDSERFHSSGWGQRRDRRKGNAAALTGWTLLRYGWHDLVGDDRRAAAEHRHALSYRGRRPPAARGR